MVEMYVRFNEQEDAVAALELVAQLSGQLQSNPSLWKWVITAAQNAMQGAMVLALSGTDGCGALSQKSERLNRAWLQAGMEGPQPHVFMANFDTLLDRTGDAARMGGKPLLLTEEEKGNLKRLNSLRGDFAHFNPKGWSIELDLLLSLMPITLSAVEAILTAPHGVRRELPEDLQERVATAFSQARKGLRTFNNEPP
jgi:hypothetical protein